MGAGSARRVRLEPPVPARTAAAPLFDTMQQAGIVVADGEGWRSTRPLRHAWAAICSCIPPTRPRPRTPCSSARIPIGSARAIEAALADGAACTRAVDLCSGAGPGAVTIARRRPAAAEIVMADINEAALAASRINAALAGLQLLRAQQSDLLAEVDGDFDLIVANPPYLNDPAQRAYRHGGGRHGSLLSLRILEAALGRLRPGGRLVLYTGVAILDGVDPFLAAAHRAAGRLAGHWRYREVDPDVFGEELEEPRLRRGRPDRRGRADRDQYTEGGDHARREASPIARRNGERPAAPPPRAVQSRADDPRPAARRLAHGDLPAGRPAARGGRMSRAVARCRGRRPRRRGAARCRRLRRLVRGARAERARVSTIRCSPGWPRRRRWTRCAGSSTRRSPARPGSTTCRR